MRSRALGPWLSLLVACGSSSDGGAESESEGEPACLAPSGDDQTAVQQALVEVAPGGEVCFAAGTFRFTDELALDVPDVTLRGAGRGEAGTIWDFSGQQVGANALHVTSDGVTVQGIRLLDPNGDGMRATDVERLTFRDLHVEWTRGPHPDNGAYGLYPVQSRDVLIEDSVVVGSSDAGIYAGQCENVVVRGSEAYHDVLGIEIENTVGADVYGNDVHDCTAGIAVFDLPGLPMVGGHSTRVHYNTLHANNLDNFAAPEGLIALVPPGSGVLILASDRNEVFANTIDDHKSFGVGVISFCATLKAANDDNFDVFPQGNDVHDNTITQAGYDPAGRAVAIAAAVMVDELAALVWDGAVDPTLANDDGAQTNCFADNTGDKGGAATFLNFDLADINPGDCTTANATVEGDAETDLSRWTCRHDPVPAVVLPQDAE